SSTFPDPADRGTAADVTSLPDPFALAHPPAHTRPSAPKRHSRPGRAGSFPAARPKPVHFSFEGRYQAMAPYGTGLISHPNLKDAIASRRPTACCVRQQTGSAPHAAVACSVRPRSVFSCTDALTWRI